MKKKMILFLCMPIYMYGSVIIHKKKPPSSGLSKQAIANGLEQFLTLSSDLIASLANLQKCVTSKIKILATGKGKGVLATDKSDALQQYKVNLCRAFEMEKKMKKELDALEVEIRTDFCEHLTLKE